MKAGTTIKVKEVGTENLYNVQLIKATIDNPNILGFDHKFKEKDLVRLEDLGKEMGLNVVIEGNMIEFQDNTKVELPEFDFFVNSTPETNFNKFCDIVKTKFEVC